MKVKILNSRIIWITKIHPRKIENLNGLIIMKEIDSVIEIIFHKGSQEKHNSDIIWTLS